MTHPPDGSRPPGRDGPVEPGAALHRRLVMVAEAIVRSRTRESEEVAEGPAREQPPGDDTTLESLPSE